MPVRRSPPGPPGYLQTYVERDVRQLMAFKDLRTFETFLGLCAARHAQELNVAELGRLCGLSQPACKAWLSVLEASYVLWMLPPFFNNLGKRLIKTPKAFFEGWVVTEARKAFAAHGRRPGLYFWRSHDGLEVDLIVEKGGRLHPVEIRQTSTPLPGHTQGLIRFRALAGQDQCGDALLVCTIATRTALPGDVTAIPWHEFSTWTGSVL